MPNEAARSGHQYTSLRAHLRQEEKGSSVKQRYGASRCTHTLAVITNSVISREA
jgi:hypothetical protein